MYPDIKRDICYIIERRHGTESVIDRKGCCVSGSGEFYRISVLESKYGKTLYTTPWIVGIYTDSADKDAAALLEFARRMARIGVSEVPD